MTNTIKRLDGIVPGYLADAIASRLTDQDLRKALQHSKNLTRRLLDAHEIGQVDPRTPAGEAMREVWDAQDEESDGVKVRSEGQPPVGDRDTDLAYDFTGDVRQFYRDVHGWNSIDGRGMNMVSRVHFGFKFNNAFWQAGKMTYGRGDGAIFATFLLPDIAGHEITHGVTEFSGDFEYFGQSGALNESLSDVFGKLIQMYAGKTPVEQFDWVLGRGIFTPQVKGVGLRHMLNPGTAYNDASRLGRDPQPAHFKDYVVTWNDNGGVHINSGIPNRAFALFAIALGGFPWEIAGQIWFAARPLAGTKPSFASFAFQTLVAADKLGFGAHKDKLLKAWSDVGVTPAEFALDTLTPVFEELPAIR